MKWRPPQFQKLSASSGPNLQIEKFTESIVFTGLLTFGTVFGMLMMHVIAIQLEMPYGEEFLDLPLLETKKARTLR